jgi:hypothetical protein
MPWAGRCEVAHTAQCRRRARDGGHGSAGARRVSCVLGRAVSALAPVACDSYRDYLLAMSPPRPNLFLIGSMKSGTTYLSELLAAHPAIFMCSPKEPGYFVDPRDLLRAWPAAGKAGYLLSAERYLGLFASAGNAVIVAEASTSYTQLPLFPGVPERILAFNPHARFIYIMRDPVERTISHYWQRVRWGVERRPIAAAIRAESHYGEVSHYARQLKAYLQHVERRRIYILTQEALLAAPVLQLSRIYAWLGVEPSFRPATLGVPNNVLPDVVDQVRGFGVLHRLSRSAIYRNVAPRIPRSLRRLGNRLALRSVRPADVHVAEVEAYLRPQQQLETEELRLLLGRSFPEWTTLYAHDVGQPEITHAQTHY